MDKETRKLCYDAKSGKMKELIYSEEGILKFRNRLYVPNVEELRWEIIEEAHYSAYAMHPGSTKMYRMLKKSYWWKGMKSDRAKFILKYLTYHQVKVEHKHPTGLLQSLLISEWKWEHITTDFMVGLPRTQ